MTDHYEEMCISKNGTLFEAAKCPFLALKMGGDNEVCINKNPCIFLSNSLGGNSSILSDNMRKRIFDDKKNRSITG